MKDLFETPELIPQPVKDIIDSYPYELQYTECESMLKKLNEIGYTFEYGLDAIPYNLQEITNK